MADKPRLVLTEWVKGEPIRYCCSVCDWVFLLPDIETPKEAAAKLTAAFGEHVREKHSEDITA